MTDTLSARHVALSLSEKDFQQKVVDRARWNGWLCFHARPARMKDGQWRTPTQGDRGYPDLTLVHPVTHRLVFAELKSESGRLTDEQKVWLTALPNAVCWRPSDWPMVCALLDGEA